MLRDLDFSLYFFISGILWTLFSILVYFLDKKKNINYNTENTIIFSIIVWIFNFISFSLFVRALEWNLAVVFTINSFSILIPIILSIIFFKEHFSLKKAFVIGLSIISIILFI